jgi:hypothetical protein
LNQNNSMPWGGLSFHRCDGFRASLEHSSDRATLPILQMIRFIESEVQIATSAT